MMKWKIALGLGLACAACCAIPAMIGVGALGVLGLASGSAGGIAIGAALLIATASAYWIQRRRNGASPSCAVDGSCGCKQEGVNQ